MPSANAPAARIDREWLNSVELDAFEAMLYAIWDIADALTLSRGMYGQVILPPEQAAAKRAAQMAPQAQIGGQNAT